MAKQAKTKAILKELRVLGDDLRSRLDSLDGRIKALENGGSSAGASPRPAPMPQVTTLPQQPRPGEDKLRTTERDVTVTVSPLNDASLARVVEAALAKTDGVESATLRELSGNSAHLDVKVEGDVALITGLRRTLPLAFDVTESDSSSFTIALAQPRAERADVVAVQSVS